MKNECLQVHKLLTEYSYNYEVARAIRALEIGRDRPDEVTESFEENRQALVEELGDVLGNVMVIANKETYRRLDT